MCLCKCVCLYTCTFCEQMFLCLHTCTHGLRVTWTWVRQAWDKSCCLFSPVCVHQSPASGEEGQPKGWAGDRVQWISPDRKRAERKKKKKISPFSKEWLALLSGELRLRSLNDKDATDRLKADDHIKQAQESQWRRALSRLTKPNWILMMISKWSPRGAAGASVVVQSRQTAVIARRDKASLSELIKPLLVEAVWGKLKYECMC